VGKVIERKDVARGEGMRMKNFGSWLKFFFCQKCLAQIRGVDLQTPSQTPKIPIPSNTHMI